MFALNLKLEMAGQMGFGGDMGKEMRNIAELGPLAADAADERSRIHCGWKDRHSIRLRVGDSSEEVKDESKGN